MKRTFTLLLTLLCLLQARSMTPAAAEADGTWPDGTPIDAWFSDTTRIDPSTLGRRYVITRYGVKRDSTLLQTEAIQAVIDRAAREGGGVVVIPRGTFLSAALFFRQGTHLCVEEGARLKAIDDIRRYPVLETRIEGETRRYFSAFINADSLDGFTLCGKGTIDGNGLRFWEEFWVRRVFNPQCTNVDAMRYRLVYLSNCRNVTVQDLHLVNSPFWTNHLYRCHHVRYLGCTILSPTSGIGAYGDKSHGGPSTDAIDLDVCHDILVHGCYMSVNDDAVVLKGGKGTWADQAPENGPNHRILVQHCRYGVVHGCLTIGSESLHSRNVILRHITFDKAHRVLWLKMRPDTPQHYEYIRLEHLRGSCGSFLVVRPWTQFFKPGDRPDMPLSRAHDVTIRDVDVECSNFFDVGLSDKYALSRFSFLDSRVRDKKKAFHADLIPETTVRNLVIE